MDSRSSDSGTSLYSTLPDPCGRCKQTICFFLHSYSASACPYSLCPECRELEALDVQIMDTQNLLIDLSNRRRELKGRINRRHDHFTSRLPVELISDVFALVVHGSNDSDSSLGKTNQGLQWDPVLMLGGVCRRWRDITLGTPTLWTKISVGPQKETSFYDFTAQWLSRSGTLPLSLKFRSSVEENDVDDDDDDDDSDPIHIFPHASAVQLLKSHADRWKDLTLAGSTAMLPMIMTGMEDRLVVDSLLMNMDSDETDEITMRYPFVPKLLHIRTIPVRYIPVQWDRLTHLKADYISADGLVYIIGHARNLQTCLLQYIRSQDGYYPIPTSPVTNDSVKECDVEFVYSNPDIILLLRCLTFPSLEILRYSRSAQPHKEDLHALSDFLNRSQPPLQDFFFRDCYSITAHGFDWSGLLPSITSLELDVYRAGKALTKIYIDTLGAHVEPMAFPRLRELKIKVYGQNANSEWWNGLAAVFPDSQINQDAPAPMFSRPLKTVTVSIDPSLDLRRKIMDRATRARLRAIRHSGVDIEVFNSNHGRIDVLGPSERNSSD